jgi:hypothetical protein
MRQKSDAQARNTETEGSENEQTPESYFAALKALLRCLGASTWLLLRRQTHIRRDDIGRVIAFADGTSAPVYRETVVDGDPHDPCFLVVTFRLRLVRGWGHRVFRWESLLNTPLFVGFPGLVSKLWLAHDQRGAYRGVYEWDGPDRAEHYARCLWRVLALVSVPGSIKYQVVPGIGRDEALRVPHVLDVPGGSGDREWWRPVS